MRNRAAAVSATVVLGATALLGGCTSSPEVDYAQLLAQVAAAGNHSYFPAPSSVSEALPTTSFDMGEGRTVRISDMVVQGRMTGWERGTARTWRGVNGAEDDSGRILEWNSEQADARFVEFTFEVDRVLSNVISDPADEITVVVPFYVSAGETEAAADQLLEQDQLVVFLHTADDPADAVPRGPYRISLNNALLGEVSPDGTLTMPVLSAGAQLGDVAPAVRSDLGSVDELLEAARSPDTVEVPIP